MVSLFVHNLGKNPVGRALPIARAFERLGHKVEVLGFLTGGDEQVYAPYRGEIETTAIETSLHPTDLFPNIRRLGKAARGEFIYAFKPLVTSFAPAYYAARIDDRRPLLLDVEDEEIYTDRSWRLSACWRKLVRGWRLGTSWKYTRLLQLFRRHVDAVTVVSTALQQRYGGTLLRHGPDETVFDPDHDFGTREDLRRKWELPRTRKLAVFVGTPRSHKGLDVIAEALQRSEAHDWNFVLVGADDSEFTRPLKEKLGRRYHALEPQPYRKTPELLTLADAVPIPSKDTEFARAQVPAKLLDAMAMARPIVASKIGDLPDILGRGKRGWLIEPDNPASLAQALNQISKHPEEARRRGKNARKWYREHASTEALSAQLENVIEEAV